MPSPNPNPDRQEFPYHAKVLRQLFGDERKDFVHAEEKILWRDRMQQIIASHDEAIRQEVQDEECVKRRAASLQRDGSAKRIQATVRGYRDRAVLTTRRLLRHGEEALSDPNPNSDPDANPDGKAASDLDLDSLGEVTSSHTSQWARRARSSCINLLGGDPVERGHGPIDEATHNANVIAVENRIETLQSELIDTQDNILELQGELMVLQIDEASLQSLERKVPERACVAGAGGAGAVV